MVLKILCRRQLFSFLMLIGMIGAVSGCASQTSQEPSSPSPSNQSSPSPSSSAPSSKDSPLKTITIRVSGANGTQQTPFSGTYGTIGGGHSSVTGTTPAKYQVDAKSGTEQSDVVTAVMQKQADDDTELTVLIVTGGEIKKEQSTTESFGVVGVDYDLSEG